jgi:hypothetical protein
LPLSVDGAMNDLESHGSQEQRCMEHTQA